MTLKEKYKKELKKQLRERGFIVLPSRSFDSTFWFIKLKDNKLICNCPGFKTHKHCKHIYRLYHFLADYDLEWNY